MTTPTSEAIEAAARALHEHNKHSSMAWDDHKQTYRAYATAALSAAYPLMEAKAKAEALREAADEADMWSMAGAYFPEWERRANWLRAGAAAIEGKSE